MQTVIFHPLQPRPIEEDAIRSTISLGEVRVERHVVRLPVHGEGRVVLAAKETPPGPMNGRRQLPAEFVWV